MKQKTLKRDIVFHGTTLFSAEEVSVRLSPGGPESGIIFKRGDEPNSDPIQANVENLFIGNRCTKVGKGEHSVQLIEHFMSAVQASGIDNLVVEVSGSEMPIFDGSALPFLNFLDQAGVVEQSIDKELFYLDEPLYLSDGEWSLIALPSDQYRISYTLHYPASPYLRSQYYSCPINLEHFRTEIAPCRTFILHQEATVLAESGLLKNLSLEHGVVIEGDRVLNHEGVRFPDEMVRHKILDMIGDFSLLGGAFHIHLIGIKTGHRVNHEMARKLRKFLKRK